jgi:hypothetical protein
LEGERKSGLTDGSLGVGFFDRHGKAELRNWLLLRGFGHSAKKQDRATDDNPSSKSLMIATKHGVVTPFTSYPLTYPSFERMKEEGNSKLP